MFNITHNPKPGKCQARRCSRDSHAQGLCDKHYAEWQSAGSPPFSGGGTAITGTDLVPAGTLEALAEERISAQQSLDLIRDLQITDQSAMDQAGEFLSGVREARKDLTFRKDKATGHLKKALAEQNEIYTPVDRVYAECEAVLRDRINEYLRRQQEAQDRARKQVEDAAGKVSSDTLVLAHGIENVALPVGMGVRETWCYEVQDEVALRRAVALGELVEALGALIPTLSPPASAEVGDVLVKLVGWLGVETPAERDLLTLNTKTLASYAREHKNASTLPGVRVFQQTTATAPRARARA